MIIFTCKEEFGAMMTCIYEAYACRQGHKNIRMELEPVYDMKLFCEYRHIDCDESKASSVVRSIRKNISMEAWQMVYHAAMSFSPDRLDSIYRFLLLGFHYGSFITSQLQHPAVSRLLELSRKVTNEAHQFQEFIRFHTVPDGILVSHIEPKCDVLSLVAPFFQDRMPSEHWMIIDDNRKTGVVHPADQPFYLTSFSDGEMEQLRLTEQDDLYDDLFRTFFQAVMIKPRENKRCQRTMMPIWYRRHATEFL